MRRCGGGRGTQHTFAPPHVSVAFLLLASVLLVFAGAARAADDATPPAQQPVPVQIETRVEPKTVTIGTPLRYTIRVVANKDTELVMPQLAGKLGDFQVIDFGSTPPHDEKEHTVAEEWYTLLTYDIGDKVVPGPSIRYRTPGNEMASAAAPDASVVVQSLLDVPGRVAVEDVRDIKGPVAVPHDYRPLLWIAAAVLAVAALGGLLYRLFSRRGRVPLIIPRPAHEVALEALAKLQAARLIEEGRHEEFYVRLSDIVRTYLEVRFRLRAPEMTTEEFLQAAQRDPQLAPPQRSLLSTFLSEADLVKFARYVPESSDAERAYRAAGEFVRSTTPEVPRVAA